MFESFFPAPQAVPDGVYGGSSKYPYFVFKRWIFTLSLLKASPIHNVLAAFCAARGQKSTRFKIFRPQRNGFVVIFVSFGCSKAAALQKQKGQKSPKYSTLRRRKDNSNYPSPRVRKERKQRALKSEKTTQKRCFFFPYSFNAEICVEKP